MAHMSLDRERAAKAWASVSAVGAPRDRYRSLARNLPAMIQSTGLGQCVAFLMALEGREREEAELLLRHLSDWLQDEKCPIPWSTQTHNPSLMERLTAEGPEVWWYAEREAIEFAVWLKRFAEASARPIPTSGNTARLG